MVIIGSYSKAMTSGTIAAGLTANSLVYGFKWGPSQTSLQAAALCKIRRITVAMGDLVGFTAGLINVQGFIARDYKTLEGTGGTAGTFTGSNAKLATAMPTSAGASCYMTTTAAISGGTHTDDTDPFIQCALSVQNTAGFPPVSFPVDLFYAAADDAPLTLANNEGFCLKLTQPATGTSQLGVTVTWDEWL